jgi:hypothetical protein
MIASHEPAPCPRPAPLPESRRLPSATVGAAARRAVLAAVLGAVLAAAPGARAGVVLTGEHKTLDGSQPAFTYTVTLDKDKARMETSNSPSTAFIYRADKGVFWIVDDARKTYSEMSRKDLESMAASMDAMMRQMMDQLAQLPPEQRSAMEKMIKENMGGGGTGSKPTFKRIGAGKVGEWACERYDAFVDGKKRAELCFADPVPLGFSSADFGALKDMGKTFEKFAKDLRFMLPPDSSAGMPGGAPVKSVIFEGGKAHAEAVLKQVKKGGADPARFEVPPGYAKKAMSASDLGAGQ